MLPLRITLDFLISNHSNTILPYKNLKELSNWTQPRQLTSITRPLRYITTNSMTKVWRSITRHSLLIQTTLEHCLTEEILI